MNSCQPLSFVRLGSAPLKALKRSEGGPGAATTETALEVISALISGSAPPVESILLSTGAHCVACVHEGAAWALVFNIGCAGVFEMLYLPSYYNIIPS